MSTSSRARPSRSGCSGRAAVVAAVGGGSGSTGWRRRSPAGTASCAWSRSSSTPPRRPVAPRLVVLEGEAGVGKSRLAWEFEKYVDGLRATVRWHRGRCLSYGDGVAFWALAEAVRARLGLVEGDSGDGRRGAPRRGLARLVREPSERDWLRPRLAVLLGAGAPGRFARRGPVRRVDGVLRDPGRARATAPLGRPRPRRRPVTPTTGCWTSSTTCSRPPVPDLRARARATGLLARRPDLGGRRTTVVRLEPLDDTADGTLLDGLVEGLPQRPARRWSIAPRASRCTRSRRCGRSSTATRRAAGGPLRAGARRATSTSRPSAPRSLQALVAARLDALAPAERRVVDRRQRARATFTERGRPSLAQEDATSTPC